MWLGEVTRKRPKRVSFEEFLESNQPSEVRPLAYAGGTIELTPPRIWYGDFKQRAVERDSHWTDYLWAGQLSFLLDTITVAYRYYLGEAFALCYGPDRHVQRVTIDDRLMFQASLDLDNAGGSFLIDDPQAWGGDQPPGEGGQYSFCAITRGNYTDPANSYLESLLATPPNKCPGLRGISALISVGPSGATESGYFAAGGVGFTPRLKEWKVVVRGQPDNLATGFNKIGPHMNPMETIYEWMTSLEYGARVPLEEINLANLRANAEALHDESNGWSGQVQLPTSPEEVVRDVLAQIDAVPDNSPSLGLGFRLIRRDYSFGSLRVLDQSVITRVNDFTPGTYEDTVNHINVEYPQDEGNDFAPRKAQYIDPANQQIQGGREVPQTVNFLGVADSEQAQVIATRLGRAQSLPRAPLDCFTFASWGRLTYIGEVVLFEWRSPSISVVMRVEKITPNGPDEQDYHIVFMEDQFSTGLRTFGEPSPTGHTDPATALLTAPPSASWDSATFPPEGLEFTLQVTNTNQFQATITGHIIFGSYSAGGQYARIHVTEPGGVQTLSPIRLSPDADNKAQFSWPALTAGVYEFCVQTYSIKDATNGVKVCADVTVAQLGSPSQSPSASVSPSASESPSPSPSASISPSPSISPSASASPSVSPSSSASASQSPSASESPSPSVSPSSSVSASPSPSSSVSASLSPSSSASPSVGDAPLTIANLELWLKADAITGIPDDGNITTTWPDSSGNARHATAVQGASDWPTYQAAAGPNSMPAVKSRKAATLSVDSSGWFTLPNFMTGFTAGHVFVVMKKIQKSSAVPSRSGPPLGDWGSTTDDYFCFQTDSKIYDGTGSSLRKTTVDPGDVTTNWFLYEVRTASGAWSNWKDGVSLFSTGTNTVAFGSAPFLGRTTTNTKKYDGFWFEVIFYSRVLNAAEITTIYDHLETRTGIVMP